MEGFLAAAAEMRCESAAGDNGAGAQEGQATAELVDRRYHYRL